MAFITVVAATLGLAGCSDEPSEDEMRTAVEAATRRALEAQGQAGFRGFDVFRKQGCVDTRDGSRGYDCYYAATFAPHPGARAMTVNGKGRFHRDGHKLVFEDLGAQPR